MTSIAKAIEAYKQDLAEKDRKDLRIERLEESNGDMEQELALKGDELIYSRQLLAQAKAQAVERTATAAKKISDLKKQCDTTNRDLEYLRARHRQIEDGANARIRKVRCVSPQS